MVRVGGGWEKLEVYLLSHQDQEIEKIRRLMVEQSKRYQLVLIDLLTKYGADEKLLNKYQKLKWIQAPVRPVYNSL